MHLLCPHCHNPIELVRLDAGEVACPACGSSFRLEGGSTTALGRTKIGKFELLSAVGSGSFGTVYKARDPELDRIVAVKVPRAGNLPGGDDLGRFLREARSVAQLRHPAIVPIYEVGHSDGLPYLVSEFVEGVTLADLLSARRPPPRDAAQLVAAIADALQYAHDHGVVHRDVKPSNIMLDGEGRSHVMDFGLAKREAGEITMTIDGQVLGTPAYMSPEQARGEGHQVDGRTDVYSLGVILYQLLTGELPFRGTTRMLLHQVLHDEPRPPRHLNDRLPRDLETVCLKAMAKETSRRYSTAQELADDLRRFLKGEPIQARPVGTLERSYNWARRRPAAVGLLVVSGIAALALGGVAAGVLYSLELKKANDQTQQALAREQAARKEAEQARAAEMEERHKAERASYFNRILVAEREWLANNVGRTVQLLKDCPEPLRGWEWKYLDRLCRLELHTLRGHSLPVRCVAFSPDGATLASASGPRESAASPGEVILWDARTGQRRHLLSDHTLPITGIDFSRDSKVLASAGGLWDGITPGEVKLWDVTTGRLTTSLAEIKDNVLCLAFNPDDQFLAVASGSGRFGRRSPGDVTLWDPQTGKAVRTLATNVGAVLSLDFSPDGQLLAAARNRGSRPAWERTPGDVLVWDVKTGQAAVTLAGRHTAGVTVVTFSPDGRRLASASMDQTVRLWDVKTGQELFTLRGHGHHVYGVAFTPDGKQLVSAGADGTVRVWDTATGMEAGILRGHTGPVLGLTVSSDGRLLASASDDRTVKLWDTATDQGALTIQGHPDITSLGFSPDGTRLASAGTRDSLVRVWNSATGQCLLTLRGHQGPVVRVAFSPDGRRLVSSSQDGTARVWDAVSGQEVLVFRRHKHFLHGLALSPDGQLCASATAEAGAVGEIRVWRTATGEEVLPPLGHSDMIMDLAFSPDGQRLASAGQDKTVKVWDLQAGKEVFTCKGHENMVNTVAYSRDGRRLVTASDDSTVRVWDAQDGREVFTLHGHSGPVQGATFSPDGQRLASAGSDQIVNVWDVDTGQEVLTLRGHAKFIWCITFSPDGQRLASGDGGGAIKIWEVLPLTAELRLRRQAAALVRRLSDELGLKDAMIARLRGDSRLDQETRQEALACLERYREDPVQLRGLGWMVARQPSLGPAQYELALRQAETARRLLSPQDQAYWVYLLTVGMAQYRLGKHQEALENLKRADNLYAARWKRSYPYGLAFLAMTQHRLDQKDQARTTLARLRDILKEPGWAANADAATGLREAVELIEGKQVEF